MVLVIYKMQVRGDTVDSAVKRNRYEIDMCNGTVLDKLISFSIPLMLSGILQLLFNAVDIIVVGRFTGSQALAAVRICLSEFHLEQMFWPRASMRQVRKRRCQRLYIQQLHSL